MSEELGKIEKPPAQEFRAKRKLYFVPLIYSGKESVDEYLEKFNNYWGQVETQMSNLELKLGKVYKIYHELIPVGGDDGVKAIEELNNKSCQIVKNRLEKGARLEVIEEGELLTEFMDWSKCLAMGLQNEEVFIKVYQFYTEASKKRNEHIAKQIDETLKEDETGVLFMREGHQVQFPSDIQVFYVAPPALDEIKRWFRDREHKSQE
ncbi:unnamed protein product [marine sediment metagenome]|uniref:Uncharacterized protein n=1 Tax=marine sediment metagenome TaxID=412755 RepID=X0U0Y0_9ZZZZ